ncbi:MAG: ribbon-helix-helix domain-containing protein [Alphaproteobacteria bacterium]|nr:ribbon-helix-helix domain-containing protein [Alphaproteobacteria bacterium]
MIKISVLIAGRHATSISLEEDFYQEFIDIAKEKNLSRNELVTIIDRERNVDNLSSAVRLYVLQYYKNKADHH